MDELSSMITTDAAVGGMMVTPPLLDVETLASHVLGYMNVPSSTRTTTTGLNALIMYLRGETKQSQNQQHQQRHPRHHQHHKQQPVAPVPPKVLFIIDGCDSLLVRQQSTESGRARASPGITGSHGGFRSPRVNTPPPPPPPLGVREASHTSLHDPTTTSSSPHTPQRMPSDLSQLSSLSTPPPPASRSSNSLDSTNPGNRPSTTTASSAFSELIHAIMGQSQSTR